MFRDESRLIGRNIRYPRGGLDLVFPHHENEIAQSECCHGKPMARIWMHNGLLRAASQAGKIGGKGEREAGAGGEKMSRSKGAGGLADLIGGQGGERIRFFLLRTHYRSTVLFSPEAIQEAATGLETFYRFFRRYERITGSSFYAIRSADTRVAGEKDQGWQAVAELRQQFLDSMDDDFNTGSAIGDLFELVRVLNKCVEEQKLENAEMRSAEAVENLNYGASVLHELSRTLGLFLQPPKGIADEESESVLRSVVQFAIRLRAEARESKKYDMADKIRDALADSKIVLEDRVDSTDWTLEGDSHESLAGLLKLLIELRNMARSEKDFSVADNIRDSLAAAKIVLEDGADGTIWSIVGD